MSGVFHGPRWINVALQLFVYEEPLQHPCRSHRDVQHVACGGVCAVKVQLGHARQTTITRAVLLALRFVDHRGEHFCASSLGNAISRSFHFIVTRSFAGRPQHTEYVYVAEAARERHPNNAAGDDVPALRGDMPVDVGHAVVVVALDARNFLHCCPKILA
jgi:hypothetical protein